MKRSKKGSTPKQFAYATRMMSGKADSKKEAALLSGFSISVAENAKNKIENTDGFKNAVGVLAYRSNNLLVAVMNEFEVRGLSEFSNKDLVSAMNAISSAWEKIDNKRAPNALKTDEGNPLRGVFRRRVETTEAIIETTPRAATPVVMHEQPAHAPQPSQEDLDF